jgi:hypothetical protein
MRVFRTVAYAMVLTAGLCAFFAAPAAAQAQPTEVELQSARERLQEGLGGPGLPPATHDKDPVPDFAVPDSAPYVLPHSPPLDPTASIAVTEDPPAAAETADEPAVETTPPPKPAVAEKPTQKPPRLKTGRAAAPDPRKVQKAKPKPAAPRVTLPGELRP